MTGILGGGRSIQLSYGNIYKNYEIVGLATFPLPSQGERWNTFLGGGRSILLSYRNNFKLSGFPCHIVYHKWMAKAI